MAVAILIAAMNVIVGFQSGSQCHRKFLLEAIIIMATKPKDGKNSLRNYNIEVQMTKLNQNS